MSISSHYLLWEAVNVIMCGTSVVEYSLRRLHDIVIVLCDPSSVLTFTVRSVLFFFILLFVAMHDFSLTKSFTRSGLRGCRCLG